MLISILACTLNSIVKKHYATRGAGGAMNFIFNSAVSLICALSLFIIGGVPKISGFTLSLGILFGAVTAVQLIFQMRSYELGPLSYTSVIISLSTLIPTLSGYFIWGEEISPVQGIGIALMLACFALSVDFRKSEKRASLTWLFFVIITFLTTGIIGVMQKWHQSSDFREELDGFLIIAFLFSFVFSGTMALVSYKRAKAETGEAIPKGAVSPILLLFFITSGICTAANNKLNLYLSGAMDSAVFFPVINGGGLILSALASFLIFKEKISVQKLIGLIIGAVSVILLCDPF